MYKIRDIFFTLALVIVGSASWAYSANTAYALATFQTSQGGTGTNVTPSSGQILVGTSGGTYTPTSPTTSNIPEGSNLYFTNARAQSSVTLTTTGSSGAATYSGGTLNIPNYATGGTGTVSTSSSETATYVPFYTSTNGTPALLSGGNSGFTFNSAATLLTVTNASTTAFSSGGGSVSIPSIQVSNHAGLYNGGGNILGLSGGGSGVSWDGSAFYPNTSAVRNLGVLGTNLWNELFVGTASTTNLTLSSVTGTQCLHAVAGVVSGTGSDCGSGGSSQWTGTSPGQIYYTANNVGIGTTSPWAALSVSTTSQQSKSIPLFDVGSTTGANLFDVKGDGTVDIPNTTNFGSPNGILTVTPNPGSFNVTLSTGASNDLYLSPAANTHTVFSTVTAGILNGKNLAVGSTGILPGNGQGTFYTFTYGGGTAYPADAQVPEMDYLGMNADSSANTHSLFLQGGNLKFQAGQASATTSGYGPGGSTYFLQGIGTGSGPAGGIGIGTSTPFGAFAISLNSTDSSSTAQAAFYRGNNAFIIASSTASATTTLFNVNNIGGVNIGNATNAAANSLAINTSRKELFLGSDANDPEITNNTSGNSGVHLIIYDSSTSGSLQLNAASGVATFYSAETNSATANQSDSNNVNGSTLSSIFDNTGTKHVPGFGVIQYMGPGYLAFPGRPGIDEQKFPGYITGASADQTASNFLNGGDIILQPGNGTATTSATANANGGNLYLNGGKITGGIGASGNVLIASSTGLAGVGTTTPYGEFSINADGRIGANPAFVIGSSTKTLFTVSGFAGNVTAAGTINSIAGSAGAVGMAPGGSATTGIYNSGGSLGLAALGNGILWSGSDFSPTNNNNRNLGIVNTNQWGTLFVGTASTSNLTISGIPNCSGSNALTTGASGVVACGAISGGGGGIGDPFTHTSVWNQTTSATSTLLALTGSPYALVASSTSVFTNASSTLFTVASTSYLAQLGGTVLEGTTTNTYGGSNWLHVISNAFNAIGGLLINTATNVANAFTITNAAGTQVLNVSTVPSTAPIFAVEATTTDAAILFSVDQYGHLTASSTPATPTISSCGTGSPAMGPNANDAVGDATTGTSATTCTITFGRAYSVTPEVWITDSNTSAVMDVSARSTTSFTVSIASALSAVNFSYLVIMP